MREFLSKCIAGGLSAGVVLLWSPALFDEVDSVMSWFVRGVAWTVCFELLLLALIPFERALWETTRGRRISSRTAAAGSRLHSGPPSKRIGRLSAVATAAIAVSVALLVTGLREHAPVQQSDAPVRPIKVVRVTKVVKRVVRSAPAAHPVAAPNLSEPSGAAPAAPPSAPAGQGEVVVGRSAPVQRERAPAQRPEPAPQPAPPEQEGTANGGDKPPASGSVAL